MGNKFGSNFNLFHVHFNKFKIYSFRTKIVFFTIIPFTNFEITDVNSCSFAHADMKHDTSTVCKIYFG